MSCRCWQRCAAPQHVQNVQVWKCKIFIPSLWHRLSALQRCFTWNTSLCVLLHGKWNLEEQSWRASVKHRSLGNPGLLSLAWPAFVTALLQHPMSCLGAISKRPPVAVSVYFSQGAIPLCDIKSLLCYLGLSLLFPKHVIQTMIQEQINHVFLIFLCPVIAERVRTHFFIVGGYYLPFTDSFVPALCYLQHLHPVPKWRCLSPGKVITCWVPAQSPIPSCSGAEPCWAACLPPHFKPFPGKNPLLFHWPK